MFTQQAADPELTLVRERLDGLIRELRSSPRSPTEAWGATFDAGLSRVSWPVGAGGLGVRQELQSLVDVELDRVGVPSNFRAHAGGIGVIAPVLAKVATAAQRERYLRKVFTCEELWCQLFSEPDAGSDLPSLRTRAVRDGDSWIVNGHKVWTTMGHIARRGLLLARTGGGPRQHGVTCFVVDMTAPGVEVRPLRQMTGDAEFNETILTDVVIPDSDRIGEIDGGWRVAIGTLMEERNAVNFELDSTLPAIDELLTAWRSRPTAERHPALRDRVAELYARWQATELMRAKDVAQQRSGIVGPHGSLVKLAWGTLGQEIYELCLDLQGPAGMLYDSYEMTRPASWAEMGVPKGDITRAFLRSRALTIEGGTHEVQRNTIAERVLGLPREPRG